MRIQHHRNKKRKERRRGIYVLPNLITTASLFCGFYAVISAIAGNFHQAALSVLIAAVLDGMDGRIARITRTTSAFGLQYDSLCDLIAFGLAPCIGFSVGLKTLQSIWLDGRLSLCGLRGPAISPI